MISFIDPNSLEILKCVKKEEGGTKEVSYAKLWLFFEIMFLNVDVRRIVLKVIIFSYNGNCMPDVLIFCVR